MKLIINPHNFSFPGKCYRQLWQTFASCDMQMALRINTPHSKVKRAQAPLVKLLCVFMTINK